jgi:ADP-ribosylglycohydrolase
VTTCSSWNEIEDRGDEMAAITLSQTEYRDRVHACWLGKNIGSTLGAPFEGRKYVNDLTFYDPVPTEPSANDDLDLQLVWLCMLEERGTDLSLADFAEYWQRYLMAYPWDEYGFCARNLERGLMPPMSGWFENYYVDQMGSPIRSELWACIAPADPQRAAALAWMDAVMDHAGGEGVWGEMFWAAVESAAFVIDDPRTLIRIGLHMIPPSCNIARVIREAVWCFENGKRWAAARDRIERIYGHEHPCNAMPNHGFTILGWLYGEDYGDQLCRAVNCGYDTDCTGATLGSLLGIVGGTGAIPKKWSEPIGTGIVLHKFTGAIPAPKDVVELTDRTAAMATRFTEAEGARVAFGDEGSVPDHLMSFLYRNELSEEAIARDVRCAVSRDREAEITLHYHGGPVFEPGIARRVSVECRRIGRATEDVRARIGAPPDWEVRQREGPEFEVIPPAFEGIQKLTVTADIGGGTCAVDFAALSPSEARGFPGLQNVEHCPVCHGRKGSCLCSEST